MSDVLNLESISAAVIGTPDFCRRINSTLTSLRTPLRSVSGSLAEAWGLAISNRPNLLLIEIGVQHSERLHLHLRRFLAQMRERFGSEIFVAVVLSAPEKFAFGGDLLFAGDLDLTPSGYVDSLLAIPPGIVPSIAGLGEQIRNLLEMFAAELTRRAEGRSALPALCTQGWVTSLADPQSRELWMKWLPRYASYTNENPIIIGQTGTGKTNLAFALHLLSGRKGEFVTITPRDFSSSELVQAELFGAVAGAYTGAVDKWGLVKRAEKGTLFIDELQSIDKDLQGKLITFIENKIYRRVGSSESVSADVRFVFASNRALFDMMESGILRDDFAYRLERVQLELTPLRDRRLDIVSGLAYALAKIQRQRPQAVAATGITSGAYRTLFSQEWPGNLRQLENTMARLCEATDIKGARIIDEQVVDSVLGARLGGHFASAAGVIAHASYRLCSMALRHELSSLEQGIEKFTETVRLSALEVCEGDVAQAAELIGDHSKAIEIAARAALARKELKLDK